MEVPTHGDSADSPRKKVTGSNSLHPRRCTSPMTPRIEPSAPCARNRPQSAPIHSVNPILAWRQFLDSPLLATDGVDGEMEKGKVGRGVTGF